MGRIGKIILAAIACLFFGTQTLAYTSDELELGRYFDGDGNLTLSIENGSTGILTIHYVMIIPDRSGRSAYVLFADRFNFSAFVDAVAESDGPVIADLDGTQISVRLTASDDGSRLFGRIIDTNERVYVIPEPLR